MLKAGLVQVEVVASRHTDLDRSASKTRGRCRKPCSVKPKLAFRLPLVDLKLMLLSYVVLAFQGEEREADSFFVLHCQSLHFR